MTAVVVQSALTVSRSGSAPREPGRDRPVRRTRRVPHLLGPSGCGKTTLLRIVAGLETASSGRVLIGGRDVTAEPPHTGRDVGIMFQTMRSFPHVPCRQTSPTASR